MKDLFVPYELALKLKEKGFDEPCLACVWIDNDYAIGNNQFVDIMLKNCAPNELIKAPIHQQVIDWFSKVHGIQLFCDYFFCDGFYYGYKWVKSNGEYGEWWKDNNGESPDGWSTPEEALHEAIKETLKMI